MVHCTIGAMVRFWLVFPGWLRSWRSTQTSGRRRRKSWIGWWTPKGEWINTLIHPNPSKSWITLDLAQSKRGLLQIKLLVAKSIWRNTLCTMHLVFRKGSCSMLSLNFLFHSFKKSLTKPKKFITECIQIFRYDSRIRPAAHPSDMKMSENSCST